MLKVSFDKVKPGKEQELRDWFGELMQRQDEVRETFAQETVSHEKAFLLQVGDESFLVYAIDVENEEKARNAFRNSTLPIDAEHKRVLGNVLESRISAELLYDCSLT